MSSSCSLAICPGIRRSWIWWTRNIWLYHSFLWWQITKTDSGWFQCHEESPGQTPGYVAEPRTELKSGHSPRSQPQGLHLSGSSSAFSPTPPARLFLLELITLVSHLSLEPTERSKHKNQGTVLAWRVQLGLERVTGLPTPGSVHSPSDRIPGWLAVSSPGALQPGEQTERHATVASLLPNIQEGRNPSVGPRGDVERGRKVCPAFCICDTWFHVSYSQKPTVPGGPGSPL